MSSINHTGIGGTLEEWRDTKRNIILDAVDSNQLKKLSVAVKTATLRNSNIKKEFVDMRAPLVKECLE